MTGIILIDLVGLLCGLLLFWRRRRLKHLPLPDPRPGVSIIIPARNEAETLPHLLASLNKQTYKPLEIIVVDDDSSDNTADVAASWGASVVPAGKRPAGWLGKPWACQQGAEQAQGAYLLFVDADVQFKPAAVERLVVQAQSGNSVVSVLPYHQVRCFYEYLSLFFNLIQVAGNSAGFPYKAQHAGLFGPVIMMPRSDYTKVGGHETAKDSIIEDIALGQTLANQRIAFDLFWGDDVISYRMYGEGLGHLIRGWHKNMAAGAAKARLPVLIPTFWFVTGCLASLIDLVQFVIQGNPLVYWAALLVAAFFVLIVLVARRLGSFKGYILLLYPLFLAGFLLIFISSVLFRFLGLRVSWKDRKVDS